MLTHRLPGGVRGWAVDEQVAYRVRQVARAAFFAGARWAQTHPELSLSKAGMGTAMTLREWQMMPDPAGWASDRALRKLMVEMYGHLLGLSEQTVDKYFPPDVEGEDAQEG